MTTEDDFQAALDTNPSDAHARLVFADWLQERGDERAEGYRALGRLGKLPKNAAAYASEDWCWFSTVHPHGVRHCLPDDWHIALWEGMRCGFWPSVKEPKARRQAEDAAALAFAKLPAARRAELLATTTEGTDAR